MPVFGFSGSSQQQIIRRPRRKAIAKPSFDKGQTGGDLLREGFLNQAADAVLSPILDPIFNPPAKRMPKDQPLTTKLPPQPEDFLPPTDQVDPLFGLFQQGQEAQSLDLQELDLREQFAREDADLAIERLDRQLFRVEAGRQFRDEQSEFGRNLVTDALAEQQAAARAAGQQAQRSIQEIANIGLDSIERSFDEATARAIDEGMAQSRGQEGNFDAVFGGAQNRSRTAEDQARVAENISELENIVAGHVSATSDINGRVAGLVAELSESQLNLLGVQDARARAQMRLSFETRMNDTVFDLMQSREDVQRNLDRVLATIELDRQRQEAQASGAEDIFRLPFELGADVQAQNSMAEFLDVQFEQLGIQLNPQQEANLLSQIISSVLPSPPEGQAALVQELASSVAQFGVDPTDAAQIIAQAVLRYEDVARQFAENDFSGDVTYTPGSQDLANLIFAAGSDLGFGGLAQDLATSPSMHELINVASGGKPGATKGRSLSGIGGLPRQVYEDAGVDYESIAGNPMEEMKVLLQVVLARYGGDPGAALRALSENWEL